MRPQVLVLAAALALPWLALAKEESTQRFASRGCPRGRDGVRGLQCGASTLWEFLQSNGRGLPASEAVGLCEQLTASEKGDGGTKYWCVTGQTFDDAGTVSMARTDAGMATASLDVCAGSYSCRSYTGVRNINLPEDGGASLWHSTPVVATGTVSTPYTACFWAIGGANQRASQASTQTAIGYGNAAYYTADGGTDFRFKLGVSSGSYLNTRNSLTSCATSATTVNATGYQIPNGLPYLGCARFSGTQTSYWMNGTTASMATTSAQCAGGPAAVFVYGGSDGNPGAVSPGIGGWAFGWLLGGFYTETFLSDSRLAEIQSSLMPYASVKTAKGATVSNTRATSRTCNLSDGGIFFVPASASCVAEGSIELARAATNYTTYSEQFDSWSSNTAGTGTAPVVTANTSETPWRSVAADRVAFGAVDTSSASGLRLSTGCPANQNVVFSTLARATTDGGAFWLRAETGAGASSCARCVVDGGWNRCHGYASVTDGGAVLVANEGRSSVCTGASTSNALTVELAGFQCEIDDGSHEPSAYIPTYGATATRAADSVSTSIQTKPGQPASLSVRTQGPLTAIGGVFEVSRQQIGLLQLSSDGGAIGGLQALGATVEFSAAADGGATAAVDQTQATGWVQVYGYSQRDGVAAVVSDTESTATAATSSTPIPADGVLVGAGLKGKLKALCVDTKPSKCR